MFLFCSGTYKNAIFPEYPKDRKCDIDYMHEPIMLNKPKMQVVM